MGHYSEQQYKARDDFDTFYYNLFFSKGQKILDIACSTGNFVAQDREHIIGIDIDEEALAVARKRGLRVVRHDARKKMPFRQSSFEHVHCRHLLEHMDNPLLLMQDIYRILKKRGRLVLITDNMTRHFWNDYTHKRPFTKVSLRQLAYDAGFRTFNVHDFPSSGVFGLGFLYKHGIIGNSFAKNIYLLYGRLFGKSLLLEAEK